MDPFFRTFVSNSQTRDASPKASSPSSSSSLLLRNLSSPSPDLFFFLSFSPSSCGVACACACVLLFLFSSLLFSLEEDERNDGLCVFAVVSSSPAGLS